MQLDRNHVISAGYIRNWTVGGVVECELVPSGRRLPLAPSQVGVRKKFYAGSPATDGARTAEAAERARGAVETKALPLLRDLADRWPLRDSGERAWVALWLAMTLCASPRQRQQIPGTVAAFFADLERDHPVMAAVTAEQRQELSEPEFELDSMFAEVSTIASLLGQMHWTVLHFARPTLISSDHPISTFPWTSAAPDGAWPGEEVLGSSEVRVPINPTTALLLTWLDADDRVEVRHPARHHLVPFNHGAWTQAERHRFWMPGTRPRAIGGGGSVKPIAPELFRAYDPRSSERLDASLAWIRSHVDQPFDGNSRAVVTAWMEQDGRGLRVVPVRHEGAHSEVFSLFAL